MLDVSGLHVSYGDAPALRDVSLAVGSGELVAVVGANGAGKTTLVNAVARLLPVVSGTIRLCGQDMAHAGPQAMCNAGVALIPEGRRLFGGMTVQENLEIGCYRKTARVFRERNLARVYALFPMLEKRRSQVSGTMSGGQQQLVAIARALMAMPQLLLVDEPSLGLSPLMVAEVFEAIRAIHAEGTAILLIEQSVTKALAVAQRAYVIELGEVVLQGDAGALGRDPRVREAILGLAAPH